VEEKKEKDGGMRETRISRNINEKKKKRNKKKDK
jgi:hypothetical protein